MTHSQVRKTIRIKILKGYASRRFPQWNAIEVLECSISVSDMNRDAIVVITVADPYRPPVYYIRAAVFIDVCNLNIRVQIAGVIRERLFKSPVPSIDGGLEFVRLSISRYHLDDDILIVVSIKIRCCQNSAEILPVVDYILSGKDAFTASVNYREVLIIHQCDI